MKTKNNVVKLSLRHRLSVMCAAAVAFLVVFGGIAFNNKFSKANADGVGGVVSGGQYDGVYGFEYAFGPPSGWPSNNNYLIIENNVITRIHIEYEPWKSTYPSVSAYVINLSPNLALTGGEQTFECDLPAQELLGDGINFFGVVGGLSLRYKAGPVTVFANTSAFGYGDIAILDISTESVWGLLPIGASSATMKLVRVGDVYLLPPAPEKENYIFIGWFYDEDCTTPYNGALIYANTVLYAGWQKSILNIKFIVDGSEYGLVQVPYGSFLGSVNEVTNFLKATGGLYLDSNLTTLCDLEVEVNSDLTLYAQWDKAFSKWLNFGLFMKNWGWLICVCFGVVVLVAFLVIKKQVKGK